MTWMTYSAPTRSERGRPSIVVRFPAPTCQRCPVRAQCTSSTRTGRQLMLRPREIHEIIEQDRAAQTTEQWKQRYAIRAGVEATIHQATATTGIRRSRYLGQSKTHLAHVFTATAINLIRLDACGPELHLAGHGLATSPRSAPPSPPNRTTKLGNRVVQGHLLAGPLRKPGFSPAATAESSSYTTFILNNVSETNQLASVFANQACPSLSG
jgi:Transposase DDE domain